MAIKSAVAIAVVVLVCLWLFLRDGASDGGDARLDLEGLDRISEVPAPEGETGTRGESVKTGAAPIETEPFQPEARLEPTGGWRIGGIVLLHGKPAPPGTAVGVRVHAGWWEDEWPEEADTLAEVEVEVEEGGRFTWSTTPPDACVTVVVRAVREGFRAATVSQLVLREDEPPQDLSLRLTPLDVTVEGTVRDRDGRPLPRAVVRCLGKEATCDGAGLYRVRGTSRYKKQRLSAWADGYAVTRETVSTPPPGGTARLDIVLTPGLVVSGRIIDSEGHPIAGAHLTCWSARPHVQTTPPGGAYRLTGIPAGQQSGFEVKAAGYVKRHVWFEELTVDRADHDVTLIRGSEVRGIVIDEHEEPLEGARVGVGHGFSMGGTLQTITDRDGRFVVPDIAPGSVGVHVVRSGFVQLKTSTVVPEPGVTSEPLRLELRPGQTLRGRVVDGAGLPVAQARVAAKEDHDYLEARATTAEDGTFDLADVAGPDVGIEIYRRGILRLRKTVRIAPERIDITVQRHAVIAGRVVSAATGDPIDRFRIRIVEAQMEEGDRHASGYSSELASRGRWFAGTEGRFLIDDEEFPVGTVLGLEAWAEGYAPATASRVVTTAAPDEDAVLLSLSPAASLHGRVLDLAQGTPIAGARVRWRPANAPRPKWFNFDAEDVDTASTAEDGSFRFDDVPPQAILIEVDATAYPLFREGPITTSARGVRVDRTLYLPRGATIEGVVEDGPDAPAAAARVSLSAVGHDANGGRRYQNVVADARGRFRFEGLAPGRWRISRQQMLGRYGIRLYGTDVELEDAETREVRLRPEGEAHVILTIRSSKALPAGLIVRATPASGVEPRSPGQTAVVIDGRATFSAIAAGSWSFTVHVVGNLGTSGPTASLKLDLEPGEQTASIDLQQ